MAPVDRLIEAVHEYRHLVNLEDDDCTPAPLADIAALNAARLALHAAVELAVLDGWTPEERYRVGSHSTAYGAPMDHRMVG